MLTIKLTPKNHSQVISKAQKVLRQQGLIIYPTETCYGAGVDATNQTAVNKLLAYKSRREGKPLSIAVTSRSMASNYVKLNTSAINLYQKFLPGPLTVISKNKGLLAHGVASETNTVGIRIPDYPLIMKIISQLKKPLTATSANVSYKKHPYSIKDILNNTSKKQQNLIDLIIDAGTLPPRPASTVVDTTLDDPLILRQGKLLKTNSQKTIITKSPSETINLAKTICLKNWNTLKTKPLMFLLIGDLGSGKTQFAKGIGRFLKIKAPITSPTYTIMKQYPYHRFQTKGQFLHLDTWRLQNIEELETLKLKSYLKSQNIMAIEWADRTTKPLLQLAKDQKAQVLIVKLKTIKNHPHWRQISL